MSPFATVKNVSRASRWIKRMMNLLPEGWGVRPENLIHRPRR